MSKLEELKLLSPRRLERAKDYVSDLWFPVSKPLLTKLKEQASLGKFDKDLSPLIAEVKGDISLFTFFLRKLCSLLRDEGVDIPSQSNPFELLEWAGANRLKQILLLPDRSISPHSLDSMSNAQRSRLEEMMVSASASEVIAESLGASADEAFSVAILRQLGYALIAWNYPTVYERAALTVTPERSLDRILTEMLGFSPRTLAMSLVSDWSLGPGVMKALSDDDDLANATPESIAVLGTLSHICKIGETLARANNPKLYPGEKENFIKAKETIVKTVGKNGLRRIAERTLENSKGYLTLLPDIFRGAFIFDPLPFGDFSDAAASGTNPYVEKTEAPIRHRLESLYEKIKAKTTSPEENIRELVKEIIPISEFVGGCVFSIDPAEGLLVPQLEIGKRFTGKYTAVQYDVQNEKQDFILEAFQSSDVQTRRVLAAPGVIHVGIARSLGYSQRVGVLYLELRDDDFDVNRDRALDSFNAFAYTLFDSLAK